MHLCGVGLCGHLCLYWEAQQDCVHVYGCTYVQPSQLLFPCDSEVPEGSVPVPHSSKKAFLTFPLKAQKTRISLLLHYLETKLSLPVSPRVISCPHLCTPPDLLWSFKSYGSAFVLPHLICAFPVLMSSSDL